MARRGENIYKRRDGRYEGRYIRGRKPDGRIWWGYVYGHEYADVKRRLVQKKAHKPMPYVALEHSECFGAFAERWLEGRKPLLKPSTWSAYHCSVRLYLLPELGNWRLNEIGPDTIQSWVDGLAGRLAPTTLRGVCRLLKAILGEAVHTGRLATSPYVGIRLPRVHARKPRVLTRQEQRRLEKAVHRTGQVEYLLFLYTGLRLGELCALRWSDIDFAEGTLTVQRTVQRVAREGGGAKTALVFGPPKSEAGQRRVPLPGFLLHRLRARCKRSGGQGFVVGGAACTDPRSLQKRFARLATGLGLQGAHIHTLRHTYAARCREAGIGYEVLAELMGHATPSVTILFYGGCTVDEKRENVERLRLIA